MRAARPERPVRQGKARRVEEFHRHRQRVRAARCAGRTHRYRVAGPDAGRGAHPDEARQKVVIALISELCKYATGVVADDNARLFARIEKELPLKLHRWRSGDAFNGWQVPQNWRVKKAELRKDGMMVFDGRSHTLGVARYSKSFSGRLDWEALKPRLVTHQDLPE